MTRAAILDRDGVINDHQHFVNQPSDFILYDTAAPAIRLLNEAGFLVVVATNQGGVGLGYLSEDMLNTIHEHMLNLLAAQGARIDGIAACIHAPAEGCACRKPEPGLLLQLRQTHGFDLAQSFMVGDRDTDMEAGQRAGTKTVLIATPGSRSRTIVKPDFVAKDLMEAAAWMIQQPMS